MQEDRRRAQLRSQTQAGRDQMDQWRNAVRTGNFSVDGKHVQQGKAMMASLRLGTDTQPKILFRYRTGDRSVFQEVLGEIIVGLENPHTKKLDDSAIIMICTRCLTERQQQDDAQLMIRRSHRHFDVEAFKEGDLRSMYFHPTTGDTIPLAGLAIVKDVITCPACGQKYRVDKSGDRNAQWTEVWRL